jgi:hypothetical protein
MPIATRQPAPRQNEAVPCEQPFREKPAPVPAAGVEPVPPGGVTRLTIGSRAAERWQTAAVEAVADPD